MKRQITGLHAADRCAADQVPDGIFVVRVATAYFRRQAQKPYYTLGLAILEPRRFAGHVISSRLYCNPKALWKLNWFLRDFGYDAELLGRDEVDGRHPTCSSYGQSRVLIWDHESALTSPAIECASPRKSGRR